MKQVFGQGHPEKHPDSGLGRRTMLCHLSLQVPSTSIGQDRSHYPNCLNFTDTMNLSILTPSAQIFSPFPVPLCVDRTTLQGGFDCIYLTPFDPCKSILYSSSKVLKDKNSFLSFITLLFYKQTLC